MQKLIRRIMVLCTAGIAAAAASAKTFRVTVASADVDRAAQVVKITLPPEARGLSVLVDGKGGIVPLQTEADGTARFIIATQKAGEVLTFTLSEAKVKIGPGIEVK